MEMIIDFPGGASWTHISIRLQWQQISRLKRAERAWRPCRLRSFFRLSVLARGSVYLAFAVSEIFLQTVYALFNIRSVRMTGMLERIDLEIQVPPSFPPQYRSALMRSAELCKVKKTLERSPQFEIITKEVEPA